MGIIKTSGNNIAFQLPLMFAFFDNSINDRYVPWRGDIEQQFIQRYNRFIAPWDGEVISLNFQLFGSTATSGDMTWDVEIYNGLSLQNTYSNTQSATITSYQNYELIYTDDTKTASFTKGQIITLKLDNNTTTAAGNCGGTLLLQKS